MCAGFQRAERLAGERQAVLPDERAAEAGAGHEHQDGKFFIAARNPRLGHAAGMAVVAHRQRQRTAGLFGQRRAVIRMNIPARETRRKICRLAEHAVAFVWSGNREADAVDLRPIQIVLREKFRDARNPAADDGIASFFRSGAEAVWC